MLLLPKSLIQLFQIFYLKVKFNQLINLRLNKSLNFFYNQKTKRSIINIHKIDHEHLNKIIKKFLYKIKISLNQNRRFLNKCKVLCFDLLNKNELFSKHIIGVPLHICDLKEMIIKDHPQLERI